MTQLIDVTAGRWNIEIRSRDHRTLTTLSVPRVGAESSEELWERCPEILEALASARRDHPDAEPLYVARSAY